ncbi:FHF complex subunit HOOK interacting protein 2A-like isoform X2 [Rhodnius prolixus]|uniref:FHF complex subunit HOOK interacting protein 2A-like isoform X2 n=1 Tax=Rhodnius prolixus TaxID=13249 RepID=UPI003D18D672
MLGRFSTALQNAVDVLAPPPPLHEDFVYHWKKLMKHYLEVTNNKNVPIEMTNIPARLDQLLKILIKEDEEMHLVGHPGPCLEYFLQHGLLNLLATLASSDQPPGIRQHVLQFVSKFLSNVKTPVLGHTSVYPPLQRLIHQCDGCNQTPNELYEVQYLLGLAALLRKNPHIVSVFTANSDELCCAGAVNDLPGSKSARRSSICSSDTSSLSACLSEASSSTIEKTLQLQQQQQQQQQPPHNNPLFTSLATSARSKNVRLVPIVHQTPLSGTITSEDSSDDSRSIAVDESAQFSLLDSALTYIYSPDCSVRIKACQTVMLIASIPDEKLAEVVVTDTLFISRVTAKLTDLYHQVPATVELTQIDDMHVSWGMDTPMLECSTKDGSSQLSEFLSWFDFCDQIMIEAHPIISEALSKEIKARFLGEVFAVDALTEPLALTILAKCFKISSSTFMSNVFSSWLLDNSSEREPPDYKPLLSVKHTLLNNWSSHRADLVLEALRLFEVILEKGHEQTLHSLVLVYLKDGSYLENVDQLEKDFKPSVHDPSRIEGILNSFLTLVPVKACSSENGGYEQYLAESQRQYSAVLANSHRTNGKTLEDSINVQQECSSKSKNKRTFYEGPFLRALFKSLANIPNQPYEVNLELTSLVSRLCLRPEEHLSRFLVENAVEQLVPEAVTLHSVIQGVVNNLVSAVIDRPQYQTLLKQTRARLIGDQPLEASLHRQESWSSSFENIIVVEELCKELAAIAYVKYKHSVDIS